MILIRVKLLYFSELKEITHKAEEYLELSNDSLKILVDLLIIKYPQIKNIIWNEKAKDLNDNISIIINHEIPREVKAQNFHLKNNDVIAFLLPVAGG